MIETAAIWFSIFRLKPFVKRHGRLVQVELDALPPDVLRGLYTDAIAEFWDPLAYDTATDREETDRRTLEEAV